MSIADRASLRAALYRLLNIENRFAEVRDAPELVSAVADVFPDSGPLAPELAWSLLKRSVLSRSEEFVELPDGHQGRRPFLAAKVLLAFGDYPNDLVRDTGKSEAEHREHPTRGLTSKSTFQNSKTLRRRAAMAAGNYGGSDVSLTPGKNPFRAISNAVLGAVEEDLSDRALLQRLADEVVEAAAKAAQADEVTPQRHQSGSRLLIASNLEGPLPRILAALSGLLVIAVMVVFAWIANVPKSPDGNTAVEVDEPGVAGADQVSGPARDEVAMDARTSQVVLNSVFNHPEYGDERNFVQIKVATEEDSEYTDTISLEPGQVYSVRIFIHNDASPSSGSSATGTRLEVQAPGVVRASTAITAFLSAENAAPASVWDSVVALTPSPDDVVALRYVRGSASLTSLGASSSLELGDELFESGLLIGCGVLDGVLPPTDECAAYVTFEFRVDQPNFTIEAAARIAGSGGEYSSNLAVHPGDLIEVRIVYTNTGTTQQDDVSVRIMDLPPELRYVGESARIANSSTGSTYAVTTDAVAREGLNAGSYQPDGNFYLKVTLQVDDEAAAGGSGWLRLDPLVRLSTTGGYKESGLLLTLLP